MNDRLSVWNTAPTSAPAQRADRYMKGSAAHPARTLPALARHAITTYTRPGDLVLDPMCGIGTTLVEAVHLGRHALGVEYEPRWAHLAEANLRHADRQGATGGGVGYCGDARQAGEFAPAIHRWERLTGHSAPSSSPTLLGNAVAPQQAARAIQVLAEGDPFGCAGLEART
ncbi:TRM11 family SAM-dependent methyltransferase [Streptomyces sp. BH055]|uniref:TRM11 family SAM-dependent methyltransferase n=1 Tax=Streptomyces sp. BH055 TaxID=3401173 RepID=UPI003BB782AF